MKSHYLCIHGHFYQPPRSDPFTGQVPKEPDAAPYTNWNERITVECYAPNADARHFERISFNLGGTLARWLDDHAPTTYKRIVEAERAHWQSNAISNGLAQPVHHTILPLARRREKIHQVRWGIASFVHRFGHRPMGVWLPEMAVDYETLEVLAAEGVHFTILSDEQVRGDLSDGSGPYRVRLPNGGEIAIFVRDRHLSNSLSFHMPDLAHINDWLQDQIERRRDWNGLHLIATDGETFGHHYKQGVKVLTHILEAAENGYSYDLTTLGIYLHQNPPRAELEVIENTAWSCCHGLSRWVVGCGCTPGDSRWKGALRRALDNLAATLDLAYLDQVRQSGVDAWALCDDYFAVVLGQMDGPTLLQAHGLGHLSEKEQKRLMALLEAQFYRQRMFASCTFFFEDLDRHEPCYAIANAIRALILTRYATGEDLSPAFRRDLGVAVSGRTGRTGVEIFDALLAQVQV